MTVHNNAHQCWRKFQNTWDSSEKFLSSRMIFRNTGNTPDVPALVYQVNEPRIKFEELIGTQLENFLNLLKTDPNAAQTILDGLKTTFDALPAADRARLGIRKDDVIKSVQDSMRALADGGSVDAEEKTEIQAAVVRIITDFLFESERAIIKADADAIAQQPDVPNEPMTSEAREALRRRLITSLIVFSISMVTTGITNYNILGSTTEPIARMFDDPRWVIAMNYLAAGGSALALTEVIRRTKEELVKNINRHGDHIFQGYRRMWKEKPVKTLIGHAVLAFSIYANAVGGFMAAWEGRERRAQIKHNLSDIDAEQRAIETAFIDLQKNLRTEIQATVTAVLKKEDAGAAASGKSGRGPVYLAKEYAFTDNPAVRQQLEGLGAAAADQLRVLDKHSEVVGDGDSFATEADTIMVKNLARIKQIFAQVDALQAEVAKGGDPNVLNPKLREITGLLRQITGEPGLQESLDQIDTFLSSSSAGGNVDVSALNTLLESVTTNLVHASDAKVADRISKDVEKFQQKELKRVSPQRCRAFLIALKTQLQPIANNGAEKGIFQDTKGKLGDLKKLYDDLLLDINTTANAGNANNLDTITFELGNVVIKDLPSLNVAYKNPMQIKKYLFEQFPDNPAAVWGLLALIATVCGTLDIWDLAFLNAVKEGIHKDRSRAKKGREKYIDPIKEQTIDGIFHRINRGAYAQLFLTNPVPRELIADALDEMLNELNPEPEGTEDHSTLRIWNPLTWKRGIPDSFERNVTSQTTRRYNNEHTALALFAWADNPDNLRRLEEKFLPGLSSFLREQAILADSLERMTSLNEGGIEDLTEAKNKKVNQELLVMRRELADLKDRRTKADTRANKNALNRKLGSWLKQVDKLDEKIAELEAKIAKWEKKLIEFSTYEISPKDVPDTVDETCTHLDMEFNFKQLAGSEIESMRIIVMSAEPGRRCEELYKREIDTIKDPQPKLHLPLGEGITTFDIVLVDVYGREARKTYTIDRPNEDLKTRRIQDLLRDVRNPSVEGAFGAIRAMNDQIATLWYKKSPFNRLTAESLKPILEQLRTTREGLETRIDGLKERHRFFEPSHPEFGNELEEIYTSLVQELRQREAALENILGAASHISDSDTSMNWETYFNEDFHSFDTNEIVTLFQKIADAYQGVLAPRISFLRPTDEPLLVLQKPGILKRYRRMARIPLKLDLKNIERVEITVESAEDPEVQRRADIRPTSPCVFMIQDPLEQSELVIGTPVDGGGFVKDLPLLPGINTITITYTTIFGETVSVPYTVENENAVIEATRIAVQADRNAAEEIDRLQKEKDQKDRDALEYRARVSAIEGGVNRLTESRVLPFLEYWESTQTWLNEYFSPDDNLALEDNITQIAIDLVYYQRSHEDVLRNLREEYTDISSPPLEDNERQALEQLVQGISARVARMQEFLESLVNRLLGVRPEDRRREWDRIQAEWGNIIQSNEFSTIEALSIGYEFPAPDMPAIRRMKEKEKAALQQYLTDVTRDMINPFITTSNRFRRTMLQDYDAERISVLRTETEGTISDLQNQYARYRNTIPALNADQRTGMERLLSRINTVIHEFQEILRYLADPIDQEAWEEIQERFVESGVIDRRMFEVIQNISTQNDVRRPMAQPTLNAGEDVIAAIKARAAGRNAPAPAPTPAPQQTQPPNPEEDFPEEV